VDAKCTLVEKAPITEDLESEIVSEVELKWISSKKPKLGAYAVLSDLFKCFEVDVIHVTGITAPATATANAVNVYYNFAATIVFAPTNATNKLMTFTSSNPVHTIDSNGVVLMSDDASATTLTATTLDGSFTASTVLTVSAL